MAGLHVVTGLIQKRAELAGSLLPAAGLPIALRDDYPSPYCGSVASGNLPLSRIAFSSFARFLS